jgi:hypothetical protein
VSEDGGRVGPDEGVVSTSGTETSAKFLPPLLITGSPRAACPGRWLGQSGARGGSTRPLSAFRATRRNVPYLWNMLREAHPVRAAFEATVIAKYIAFCNSQDRHPIISNVTNTVPRYTRVFHFNSRGSDTATVGPEGEMHRLPLSHARLDDGCSVCRCSAPAWPVMRTGTKTGSAAKGWYLIHVSL